MAYLELRWSDAATGTTGFLVIDRLVRGVASGGLRMRAGCTLEEVRGLAEGMTLKEALHYDPAGRYVPLGGAKGGIDFDPYDPRAREILARYLTAMRPLIERQWTMGEDFGLRQDTIDEVLAELGIGSSVQAVYPLLDNESEARARLATAFCVRVDGVPLDELVGGYGVAEATLAAISLVESTKPVRAVVQGFGSMGGATARYLAASGVSVVAVADRHGVVANPAGLDVENLLRHRDPLGDVDRSALCSGDRTRPAEDWLSIPADILVPAAVSYCIDEHNCDRVAAKLIVEAANLPVTIAAERRLAERGVIVIPDFLANSATNAWWWWTLFGDIEPTAESAFGKIHKQMHALVEATLARGGTPREAALALAQDNLDRINQNLGT
ncbi:Glu/Leu/Phe/Val dehydrogenase dimerization domain-containing protein [Fodinicola acaciae]|uniref:Glu/Leu/Phe/Val dehydrogenase dimerization domain-containing protein n=1 Tax=Fodinicola acaciae TaxID=2681555 RepID=UPI0013D8676B|nr:Glu/Leu/Phe/Val dehydrogenase dimerization domain-containing protein [Fodinicola acaciae]